VSVGNTIKEPLQNYVNPLHHLSVKLVCSTTKGCRDLYSVLLNSVLPTLNLKINAQEIWT